MKIESLRDRVPGLLQQALREHYKGAVLYGSRARGDASPESDVDLLVLVDDATDLEQALHLIVDALYPLQLEIEVPIHAMPVRQSTFDSGTFGVLRHAKSEGVAW